MSFSKYRNNNFLYQYTVTPGWTGLANAIVVQALLDYTVAVGRMLNNDYTLSEQGFSKPKCEVLAYDVPRFLKSSYFDLLTDLDGQYLLDMANQHLCKKYGVNKDELPLCRDLHK